jgi:hypothetical protein
MTRVDTSVPSHPRRNRTSGTLLLLAAVGLLTARAAAAEPGVSDSTRWLVLLCRFHDTDLEPRPIAEYRAMFEGTRVGGFRDYFREQSYGTSRPLFEIRGWFAMPHTREQYNALGHARPTKAQWCIDASGIGQAEARRYDGFVVVTNEEGDYTGFRTTYLIDGLTKEYGVAILWGALDLSAAVHEIAHAMGLYQHSWYTTTPGVIQRGAYCQGWAGPGRECEYGDPYDIMSATQTFSAPDGRWGAAGPGFNAPNREWFGWLAPARIGSFSAAECAASPCRRTYVLADLGVPAIAGLHMIKIRSRDRPGTYFTVELRRRLGWDRDSRLEPGVILHEVRAEGLAYLVRRPSGAAEWRPGQTWRTSAPEPLSVRIDSIANGQARVTVMRTLEAPAWRRIAGPVEAMVATGAGFYVVDHTRRIMQYGLGPYLFRPVGGPAEQLVGNDRMLYQRDARGVFQFDGTYWIQIDGPSAAIAAGGHSVYSIEPQTGAIRQYLGLPYRWRKVGGAAAQVVVNRSGLFALAPDRSAVWRYSGQGMQWQAIAGPARELVVTATELFALHASDGSIYRWEGRPNAWTRVGGPGAQFVGNFDGLYALTADRASVMRFTGRPGEWVRIWGRAAELAAGGHFLYAMAPNRGAVYMYSR